MGLSKDHSLNALHISDVTIGGVLEFMKIFNESILISGDGQSGGREVDLGVAS